MRIISGEFGGRRLKSVPTKLTRPTTDKVKESLFNMIGPYFNGGHFLDLFAGSGSVGIEAVSRGFNTATLVDRQFAAVKTIHENVDLTKHPEKFKVLKMNAATALKRLSADEEKFDYVFLDPPYRMQQMVKDMETLDHLKLLSSNALVICETDDKTELPDQMDHFKVTESKHYGITEITIYSYKE